jgi:hypothetical protein
VIITFDPTTEVVGCDGISGLYATKIATGSDATLNPTEFLA